MITILTLNLRLEAFLDGVNRFSNRKEGLFRFFAQEAPDVMGFQEMTDGMLAAFEEGLSAYGFLGRRNRAKGVGEYTTIAYRKETLAPEATGTFWLSPTPEVVGSRYAVQSPDPRTCTWATFTHRPSGRRFRYFNTHLDHLSPYARARGLALLLDRIVQMQAEERLPVFLGGDFNFTPGSALYAMCRTRCGGADTLVDLSAGLASTFHWFGKLKMPVKLDYVFTDEQTAREMIDVRVLRYDDAGGYLSDHDAVRLRWNLG